METFDHLMAGDYVDVYTMWLEIPMEELRESDELYERWKVLFTELRAIEKEDLRRKRK